MACQPVLGEQFGFQPIKAATSANKHHLEQLANGSDTKKSTDLDQVPSPKSRNI